jgi:hypothetical protein
MKAPSRRKRNQRDNNPPPMVLTERDKRIIEAVYQYRVLRQDQIHTLFFGASKAASQRRLALLYHHGFLTRRFLTVRTSYLLSPALYLIDKRGAEVLRAEFGYDVIHWEASDNAVGLQFLEHTLTINDIRIAVTLACQQLDYTLLTWQGEADLKANYVRVNVRTPSGKRQLVSLIPDSYFALETPRGKTHFFLEVDRGTMTTKRFATKVAAYITYYQSGAYEQRYKTKSLRILTITLSERRMEHLRKVTENVGGDTRFWFAIHSQILAKMVLNTPLWRIANSLEPMALIEPL